MSDKCKKRFKVGNEYHNCVLRKGHTGPCRCWHMEATGYFVTGNQDDETLVKIPLQKDGHGVLKVEKSGAYTLKDEEKTRYSHKSKEA